MEPTSVGFAVPKENGGSQTAEAVEGDILGHQLTNDEPEILTSDLHKPARHDPEGDGMEEPLENEEMPDLDDFAHPLAHDDVVEETVVAVETVVTETVVVTSVNGSQELSEPLAQDALCMEDGIVSNENEDSAPNLEFSGIVSNLDSPPNLEFSEDINRISDAVVELLEVAEVTDKVDATSATEQCIEMTDKAKEAEAIKDKAKEAEAIKDKAKEAEAIKDKAK